MALTLNTFGTATAIGNREDLSNIIYMIDPTETPVISSIPKVQATNIIHEWQTQNLAAASPTASITAEGADATTKTVTPTVRLNNRCQINSKSVSISRSQQLSNPAGAKDVIARQIALVGMEIRRDMESGICQNDVVNTGSTRQSRGLRGWVVDNISSGAGYTAPSAYTGTGTTATVDGTQRAFTETLFKNVLQLQYVAGGKPDLAIMPANQKQTFSTFTGNVTRFDKAEDKTVTASTDYYVSDFGDVSVRPTRFMRSSNREVFILETEKLALAEFGGFETVDLAKTGDADNKLMRVEWTLECRAPKAHSAVYDLS